MDYKAIQQTLITSLKQQLADPNALHNNIYYLDSPQGLIIWFVNNDETEIYSNFLNYTLYKQNKRDVDRFLVSTPLKSPGDLLFIIDTLKNSGWKRKDTPEINFTFD